MAEYLDLVGRKFGLVTVVQRAAYETTWIAQCECGQFRFFKGTHLRNNPPKSHRFCHRGWAEELDSSGSITRTRRVAIERHLAQAEIQREKRWKRAERQIAEALREEGCSEEKARKEARQAVETRRRKKGEDQEVEGRTPDDVPRQDHHANAGRLSESHQRQGEQEEANAR